MLSDASVKSDDDGTGVMLQRDEEEEEEEKEEEQGRTAVLSTGDRSLLPSCMPPGAAATGAAASRKRCAKMGNSEPLPGSWSILRSSSRPGLHPPGLILERASLGEGYVRIPAVNSLSKSVVFILERASAEASYRSTSTRRGSSKPAVLCLAAVTCTAGAELTLLPVDLHSPLRCEKCRSAASVACVDSYLFHCHVSRPQRSSG